MKTLLLACALLAALSGAAVAQEATPAPPPPDPMVFEDLGMHFHAPPGFIPVGQRPVSASKLGEDPVVVAGWAQKSGDQIRRLIISMEAFQGSSVSDFEGAYEQQLRDQLDTPLFK